MIVKIFKCHMSSYFQFKLAVQDIVKSHHDDPYLYKWFKGNVLKIEIITNLGSNIITITNLGNILTITNLGNILTNNNLASQLHTKQSDPNELLKRGGG